MMRFQKLTLFVSVLLACSFVLAQPTVQPVSIVITPDHDNWEYKIGEPSTFTIQVLKFGVPQKNVMVHYQIGPERMKPVKDDSVLLKTKFDLVIIDEAHYIQNKQAQRTKLINDFVSNVERLWLLTGTPITSRPINYFNLLNLIECPVAKNWMAYVKRYCNGFQFQAGRRKIWNVSGASNLEELRDRTAPLVLRRLK